MEREFGGGSRETSGRGEVQQEGWGVGNDLAQGGRGRKDWWRGMMEGEEGGVAARRSGGGRGGGGLGMAAHRW